jgi:hypothetical protein
VLAAAAVQAGCEGWWGCCVMHVERRGMGMAPSDRVGAASWKYGNLALHSGPW